MLLSIPFHRAFEPCLSYNFTAGHADATAVLLQVPSVSHLTAFHSALTPTQLGANIKAISAGFPFGVERIMTSAECSEALENWKRRDL
jgi:copper homeostasis protein CutC